MRRCVLLVALSAACAGETSSTLPPAGQLLVYVDTDAPLPPAPGDTLAPTDPAPLFDRIRVDVYGPGATTPCAECTHEFDVDRVLVGAGHASIGVSPRPATSGYRVRVRLFRAAYVKGGQPRADATLDTIASLPPIAAEGITEVTITLRTDDVARPIGSLDAPIAPDVGRPAGGLAGTWPGAKRSSCATAARPGEVCVPGGAYWMGNPLIDDVQAPLDPTVLRIVTLSPFFLDATEVTVAAFRASGVARDGDPMPRSDDDGKPGPVIHCAYLPAAGDTDDLPVNCVSWEAARAYCLAESGDLPTEAQFQYVASDLASRLYPWGDDQPSCADAVYGRAEIFIPDVRCPGDWVEAPGSGARDRVVLPGGGIVYDLAGNLVEHALDAFALQKDPCWGTGVFHDPLCTTATGPVVSPIQGRHSALGGGFAEQALVLPAASRGPGFDLTEAAKYGAAGGRFASIVASTGFRCARPDE